ncbi:MAG: helix-turn-helix transcriptional regulator [Paracoccaceae bacterium]|nr:helix-turn-helix transcriptional regulator [Paracoccaceae bacterium]
MNNKEEILGRVINGLNGAQFESDLSEWITSNVRFDNLVILAYFQDRAPKLLYSQAQLPVFLEHFESVYLSGAYLLDPYHELHTKKSPQGLYRLNDIAPDQFNRNRYFREYYERTTMVDEIAFVAYPAEGVSVHVCLGRDLSSRQRFTNREISTAKTIAPIICALSQRHWADLNSTGTFDESLIVKKLIQKSQEQHQIKLSPRQAQVALMILQGHSSVSIGLKLEISPQTVKVFRKQLYKRCEISSQAELFTLMMPLLSG